MLVLILVLMLVTALQAEINRYYRRADRAATHTSKGRKHVGRIWPS